MKNGKTYMLMLAVSLILTGCGAGNNQYKPIETEESEIDDGQNSITDSSGDFENATEEAIPADAVSAYRIFLGMYGDATLEAEVDKKVALGYWDMENEHAGEKLTFNQLCEVMNNSGESDEDYNQKPYYSFIEAGNNTLLAVKFPVVNIYSEDDDSYAVLIFNYIDGTLHITYSFDYWAVNTVHLYENGLIESSISVGAGEEIYDVGVLSEEGKCQIVYTDDVCSREWIASATSFDVYNKYYEQGVNAPGIELHKLSFEGDTVWAYAGLESNEINAVDREFLAAIDEAGFKIVDMDIIEDKIEEEVNQLIGDSYGYSDACPVIWNTVYKDGLLDINPGIFYATSRWNYEEYFYSDYQDDETTLQLLAKADENSIVDFDKLSFGAVASELENSETEQYKLIKTVGMEGYADYFKLYLTNGNNCVILTPDGELIKFDYNLCDFIYGTIPELYPCDFDDDGEIELGIIASVFHGTGFYQQSLIILNKLKEGLWGAYHLTPQNYTQTIAEHLRFIDAGSEIEIIYNGDSVDKVSKNDDSQIIGLYYDDFVEIEFSGKDVIVRSNPIIYSELDGIGLTLGTAKLTYSFGEVGSISDFEYYKEADPKKLLNDFADGKVTDSNGNVVIYCDDDFCSEEENAEIAYVDVTDDGEDDLLVRTYGGYIPDVYSVKHGEVRCISTQCFGSSSPTMINLNHQIVHQDIYHANRQQYGVISYTNTLKPYSEIFFSDWYEDENDPSSHEYRVYKDVYATGNESVEEITKSEFDELVKKYLQEDKSIVWEKRG